MVDWGQDGLGGRRDFLFDEGGEQVGMADGWIEQSSDGCWPLAWLPWAKGLVVGCGCCLDLGWIIVGRGGPVAGGVQRWMGTSEGWTRWSVQERGRVARGTKQTIRQCSC